MRAPYHSFVRSTFSKWWKEQPGASAYCLQSFVGVFVSEGVQWQMTPYSVHWKDTIQLSPRSKDQKPELISTHSVIFSYVGSLKSHFLDSCKPRFWQQGSFWGVREAGIPCASPTSQCNLPRVRSLTLTVENSGSVVIPQEAASSCMPSRDCLLFVSIASVLLQKVVGPGMILCTWNTSTVMLRLAWGRVNSV